MEELTVLKEVVSLIRERPKAYSEFIQLKKQFAASPSPQLSPGILIEKASAKDLIASVVKK